MRTSESTKELAAALAKAQAEFPKIVKDSDNPYFKSKYADLASIVNAVQDALGKHGLAVTQHLESEFQTYMDSAGEVKGERLILCTITRLTHTSGEFEESTLRLPVADSKPQTIGSASTYARRYSLQSILRVAAEVDDDGNAASLNEHWSPEQREMYLANKKKALAEKPKKPSVTEQLKASLDASQTISSEQRKMLWAISKKVGMNEDSLREAVGKCGFESTAEILIGHFGKVLDAIDPDMKHHQQEPF